jgi:isoprenylcysteine carboxyl methyltransferase (ICMT) family protein YpbQ
MQALLSSLSISDLSALLFLIVLFLIPATIWLCHDLDRRWTAHRIAARAPRRKP